MELPNIVGRKADDATVLAADVVLAGKLKNNGLAHWQHSAGEIARPHDRLPVSVGTNGHQAFPIRNVPPLDTGLAKEARLPAALPAA